MVNAVLERLYRENAVVYRDGKRRQLVPPGIAPQKGEYLFRLVRERRPSLTLEIGFAFGLSTLFIAEALRQNGHGHHIVIDPLQHSRFEGLGLRHLEEAGLMRWVTFHEEPSEMCLPRLINEGVRVDFAFDDSGHLFDHVITEFVFLARLLRTGAVLVVDDVILPAVGKACEFLATNRPDFAEVRADEKRGMLRSLLDRHPVPAPPENVRVRTFRKVADEDPRNWDAFVPF